MKFALLLAATATFAVSAPIHAQAVPAAVDSVALGYAHQIVETIIPPARRQEMMAGLMRAVLDQMRDGMLARFTDPGLRQIVDGYLAKAPDRLRTVTERQMPLLMEAIAEAYVREFSLAELEQITAFAKTPAGEHYLSRSASIMTDPSVAAANRAYFADAARSTEADEAELRTTIANYLAKHPDVARKIAQQPGP